MTKREVYENVANGVMTDEMKDWATAELAKMEANAEKRKTKVSQKEQEKRDANQALINYIVEHVLTAEAKTASDVAAEMSAAMEEEYNVQKVSYLCRKAVEAGQATSTDVSIPKRGKVKAYALA